MNFINLLKHSLSIIAVFKTTLLIRSIIFLIFYLFLVAGKISTITLMPAVAVIMMMISVIILSKRENMSQFNSSLENIESIDQELNEKTFRDRGSGFVVEWECLCKSKI